MLGALKWMQIGLGALAGAALIAMPAYLYGRHEEGEAASIEAAKNALNRIDKLEKNNANFRKLWDRDRVLFSCVTAACRSGSATDGSGYQFVQFSDSQAARLASQDPTAGAAISSNNQQCRRDQGCRK